ncbi:MAG TPA: hypothetical protein PK098_09705 [Phycisphaerales bacterium]|nr:hypothetical protein [Phycisphaerales bacterium]
MGAENVGIARQLRFIAPAFNRTHALLAGREETKPVNTNEHTGISEYTQTLISVKANQLTGHYGFTADDREGIEEDLVVAVLEAAPSWDASRGSRNTYDNRIVHRKIATIIRHRKRVRRDYRRTGVSLDERIADEDGLPLTRGEMLADDADCRSASGTSAADLIDLAADVRAALERLDPELQHLCRLLVTHTKAAIARELGVSKPTVLKRCKAIRDHFSKFGLEEYLMRGADGSTGDGVCDQ